MRREAYGEFDTMQENVKEWRCFQYEQNEFLQGMLAKKRRLVSVAGKLCHFMEAQKVEYLRMPAWYERLRVLPVGFRA